MDEKRILADSTLFTGIGSAEISAMLHCLSPRRRSYGAGETILRAGDLALEMALVLEGSVRLERVDAWGERPHSRAFWPGRVLCRGIWPAWRASRCS